MQIKFAAKGIVSQLSPTLVAQGGDLPAQMPPNIQTLLIGSNSFQGQLPSEFSSLRSLTTIDVSSTGLTGTLPTSWGSMTSLKAADLSGNFFSGGWRVYVLDARAGQGGCKRAG